MDKLTPEQRNALTTFVKQIRELLRICAHGGVPIEADEFMEQCLTPGRLLAVGRLFQEPDDSTASGYSGPIRFPGSVVQDCNPFIRELACRWIPYHNGEASLSDVAFRTLEQEQNEAYSFRKLNEYATVLESELRASADHTNSQADDRKTESVGPSTNRDGGWIEIEPITPRSVVDAAAGFNKLESRLKESEAALQKLTAGTPEWEERNREIDTLRASLASARQILANHIDGTEQPRIADRTVQPERTIARLEPQTRQYQREVSCPLCSDSDIDHFSQLSNQPEMAIRALSAASRGILELLNEKYAEWIQIYQICDALKITERTDMLRTIDPLIASKAVQFSRAGIENLGIRNGIESARVVPIAGLKITPKGALMLSVGGSGANVNPAIAANPASETCLVTQMLTLIQSMQNRPIHETDSAWQSVVQLDARIAVAANQIFPNIDLGEGEAFGFCRIPIIRTIDHKYEYIWLMTDSGAGAVSSQWRQAMNVLKLTIDKVGESEATDETQRAKTLAGVAGDKPNMEPSKKQRSRRNPAKPTMGPMAVDQHCDLVLRSGDNDRIHTYLTAGERYVSQLIGCSRESFRKSQFWKERRDKLKVWLKENAKPPNRKRSAE